MKKILLAMAATAVAVLGFGQMAHAADGATYPPGATAPVIAPASPAPGATFTVTVDCAPDGAAVAVVFNGATTNANCTGGKATVSLTAPATAGDYPGTYTGAGAGSFTVTVAAPATPPGGLPATGSNGTSTMTIIALGLFAVGAGLFGVSQVRRRSVTA